MEKLSRLLENAKILQTSADLSLDISDLASDSAKIKKDGLFIALRGGTVDGNEYIREAAERGAAAVITDSPSDVALPIPCVRVEDAREAYAMIASNYFGNPAAHMKFIGISGTNGKTTTAHMIRHILSSNGIETGLIGTIGNIVGGVVEQTDMTTPDPYEFFSLLKRMRELGAKAVVSEISAHAVYYKKTSPVCADAAVYTNFSRDHLDFFKTMESYAEVKKSYFNKRYAKKIIVNADDGLGRDIIAQSDSEVISYGINSPCDIFAVNIGLMVCGSSFFANIFDDISYVWLPMPGLFNVYNGLAALTAASLLGVPLTDAAESLGGLPEIPGRFNIVEADKCHFVIDYAHSPDGIEKILRAAREVADGRLISVFGCGGNRDKTKRPIMGALSGQLADYTVITSDNPRFEEPDEIIRDIERGIKDVTDKYICVSDREEAIKKAYETARDGDVIVVAGKGAEPYMDIKGTKREYSDRQTIENMIAAHTDKKRRNR